MRTLVATLLLVLAGCGGAEPGYDGACGELLTESDLGTTAEARAFFDEGAVWTEDISDDDLRALVEKFYDAGAAEVVFAGIEEIEGRPVSAWLVVKLPASTGVRAAVLKVYNDALQAEGDAATTDAGQTYLDLTLD